MIDLNHIKERTDLIEADSKKNTRIYSGDAQELIEFIRELIKELESK